MRILCVDSDAVVLEIYEAILMRPGTTITQARSCKEALQHLDEDDFDWAVVSLELRDRSGLKVWEKIRAMDAPVRVIMVTQFPRTDEWIQELISQGVVEVIKVPVSTGRLVRTIYEDVGMPDSGKRR